jgi:dihydrofolate reductase
MTSARVRRVQETQNTQRQSAQQNGQSATMSLALIAAVASNRVIGAGNQLPWRLPEDMKRFRALTTGHSVIMGRKTWESLARPLPWRQNIVVTRDRSYAAPGAEIAATLDDALALVRLPPPAFCIGGGEIYRAALERADTLYLTELDRDFAGDVTFPSFDRSDWQEESREPRRSDGPDPMGYDFVLYRRREPASKWT